MRDRYALQSVPDSGNLKFYHIRRSYIFSVIIPVDFENSYIAPLNHFFSLQHFYSNKKICFGKLK